MCVIYIIIIFNIYFLLYGRKQKVWNIFIYISGILGQKTIRGKEKLFLYFPNKKSGIGVLVSDSPIGSFTDPIRNALISWQIPNCNVE